MSHNDDPLYAYAIAVIEADRACQRIWEQIKREREAEATP